MTTKQNRVLLLMACWLFGCGYQTTLNFSSKEAKAQQNLVRSSGSGGAYQALPACSGRDCCGNKALCFKNCDNLFQLWEHKKACWNLPLSEAEGVYKAFRVLKNPSYESLKTLELKALWSALEISERSWLSKIHNYQRSDAKAVLLWLAARENVTRLVFNNLSSEKPQALLKALFRQNIRGKSSLVDDNALLLGLKTPIEEEDTFFHLLLEAENNILIRLVHEAVISEHLCEYPINPPRPELYVSDQHHSACVLAVYCYLTGSYNKGLYLADLSAHRQEFRRKLVDEFDDLQVTEFIQEPLRAGGLGIPENRLELKEQAVEWPDTACQELGRLWNDGNLKFGL